jgi:Lrp/AsnC family leucine-responsive transcriptional regulator
MPIFRRNHAIPRVSPPSFFGRIEDVPPHQRDRLDDVDRQLVTALVEDGRLSFQQLADLVYLSPSTAAERVRRLRRLGVVSGYRAELDLNAIGYQLQALSDVKVHASVSRVDFEAGLADIPEVVGAVHTTGEFDYQLRVVTRGTADLERVIDRLRESGVREIHSRIVLGEVAFSPARLLD